MLQTDKKTPFYEYTCSAPVNIAVIKYWGKRDSSLILPTNSSLSITLSQDQLRSKTTIRASPEFTTNVLWINNEIQDFKSNPRFLNVLTSLKNSRAGMERRDKNLSVLSTLNLHIVSENNFPTAAGLASSASGFAAFTYTLAQLYQLPMTLSELSIIARQGSGSACRSMFGGFVRWKMGSQDDGTDSYASQVAPEAHWPDMEALILIVSDAKKHTSSTSGMQTTVATSDLLKYRIKTVPERMERIRDAIIDHDFDTFAECTMKDSNQFHAVCLDTFPPISYLNGTSHEIIRFITLFNEATATEDQKYQVF